MDKEYRKIEYLRWVPRMLNGVQRMLLQQGFENQQGEIEWSRIPIVNDGLGHVEIYEDSSRSIKKKIKLKVAVK